MKKRSLSLALALVLCLGLSIPALAYETSKPGQAATISSGYSGHTGFVDANGSLWMCGTNSRGELGINSTDGAPNFIKVMDGVSSVSCGDGFTAVVKTDGSLWMWGNNYYGALTGDVREYVLSPQKVMDDVVAVSCGNDCTAAIKKDGSLWTWGNNRNGQLGNGTTEDSTTPILIMENVAAVSFGGTQAAAIKTDGSLWAWGKSYQGEIANWSIQSTPTKIMDDITVVSCGYWNTAAVKSDGSLWVWGANDGGQLANGELHTFKGSAEPRKVLDSVTSVSCGGSHIAAVTTDGSLWMWGNNGNGQLGNGYTGTNTLNDGASIQLMPTVVTKNVTFAICGHLNTFIIKTDGSVWGCGRSLYIGGNSNSIDIHGFPMQTVPVQISGVTAKLSSPATIVSKVGGFDDVFETDYYADPVLWAVKEKITAGTSSNAFSPNDTCTSAQILTFLWRSQGKPEPTIKNPFADISAENDYFYKAAL